jgi:hypothetical protein
MFFRDIVAYALDAEARTYNRGQEPSETEPTEQDIDLLRSDNTYQVAEFYYMIHECQLADRQKIRDLLIRHNNDMEALANNRAKCRLMGLSPQRLKEARFSPQQINRVVQNIVDGRLRFEQSDVGRLLSQVIAPETCRKVLVALGRAGLLERLDIGARLLTRSMHEGWRV